METREYEFELNDLKKGIVTHDGVTYFYSPETNTLYSYVNQWFCGITSWNTNHFHTGEQFEVELNDESLAAETVDSGRTLKEIWQEAMTALKQA